MTDVLHWYIALQLAAFAAVPLAAVAFRTAPDRGYALTKAVGFLLVGYLSWLLPTLGLFRFDAAVVWLSMALVAAVGAWLTGPAVRAGYRATRMRGAFARLVGENLPRIRHALAVEALFLATFLFCVFCRSWQPEIFWGEKPMDFTFLNYFARLELPPVQDPWAAGRPMRYYYLGDWFYAALIKLTGVKVAVAYNLAMATIPPLAVTAAYGVIALLVGRGARTRHVALFGALGLAFLGNIEAVRLAFTGEKGFSFDLFWATSRVLREAMATEYPLWSFLFADLHAHVISMPFAVGALAMALAIAAERSGTPLRNRIAARTLLGIAWGSLLALNTWDFLSYSMVIGLALLVVPARRFSDVKRTFIDTASTGAFALLAISPFLKTLTGGDSSSGWVSGHHDALEQVLRVLAHYLLPLALVLVVLARRRRKRNKVWTAAPLLAGALPLLCGFLVESRSSPWGILALTALLNFEAASLVFSRARQGLRSAALLALCASTLMCAAEVYWLLDRLNTLFKIYYAVWPLLALAAAGLAPHAWLFVRDAIRYVRRLPWRQPEPSISRAFGYALTVAAVLAFVGAAFGGASAIRIMTTFQRVDGPRPTLDGTAYLPRYRPNEIRLIEWLNENVRGLPVVAEAHGDSYGDFTRVAMYTGLPTVLGWDHHVKQRGTPFEEVERRKQMLRQIYTTQTSDQAHHALRELDVSLIVVGDLERRAYTGAGLAKFAAAPELFREMFRDGSTVLYAVAGGAFYEGSAPMRRSISGAGATPTPVPWNEAVY